MAEPVIEITSKSASHSGTWVAGYGMIKPKHIFEVKIRNAILSEIEDISFNNTSITTLIKHTESPLYDHNNDTQPDINILSSAQVGSDVVYEVEAYGDYYDYSFWQYPSSKININVSVSLYGDLYDSQLESGYYDSSELAHDKPAPASLSRIGLESEGNSRYNQSLKPCLWEASGTPPELAWDFVQVKIVPLTGGAEELLTLDMLNQSDADSVWGGNNNLKRIVDSYFPQEMGGSVSFRVKTYNTSWSGWLSLAIINDVQPIVNHSVAVTHNPKTLVASVSKGVLTNPNATGLFDVTRTVVKTRLGWAGGAVVSTKTVYGGLANFIDTYSMQSAVVEYWLDTTVYYKGDSGIEKSKYGLTQFFIPAIPAEN